MLELTLLGPPRLSLAGEPVDPPGSKALAMVCYLACQPGPVPRTRLAELLWSAGASASVRVALSELRALPGAEDWLEADGAQVTVRAASDVAAFERAAAAGDHRGALAVWTSAEDPLFLNGFEVRRAPAFAEWVELQRAHLSELHGAALRGRAEELERTGDIGGALALARALLAADPLDESAHRSVMRLEHARGNREGALRQYELLRRTLHDELGVEPLPASRALLEEIERADGAAGVVALRLTDPAALPALPGAFVGRGELLTTLDARLGARGRVLLHGFGGTGKSALAATFAARRLADGGSGVLWLQAGEATAEALFDALARALDVRRRLGRADDGIEARGAALRAALQEGWAAGRFDLLVVDDAWNPFALEHLRGAVPDELPLVATARQRHAGFDRLDVGRLARAEATELLALLAAGGDRTAGTGDERGDGDDARDEAGGDAGITAEIAAGADDLCDLLGDHPLAVRIAGLTLRAEGIPPAALLRRIRDAPHTMSYPAEFAEAGRESVAALLATSARALSDPAYEALLGGGALPTASVTPELLALALRRDVEATEEALIELQTRGLVDRRVRPGSDVVAYGLHDLVHSFARANTHLRAETVMRAGARYLEAHARDFDALDAEIGNLLSGAQTASAEDPALFVRIVRLLSVGDAYYLARGHSSASLALLARAGERAEALGDAAAAHYLFGRLGDTYRTLHADYDAAFSAYERALELARRIGDRHREAITLSVLAITTFHRGEEGVQARFDAARAIAREDDDALALSLILQHQGYVAGHEGDWGRTRALCLETVEVARALQGGGTDAAATEKLFYALLNLGEAERMLGDLERAVAAREAALRTADEADNDLWRAHAHLEMGEMYGDAGDDARAGEHLRTALALYEANHAHAYVARVRALLPSEASA